MAQSKGAAEAAQQRRDGQRNAENDHCSSILARRMLSSALLSFSGLPSWCTSLHTSRAVEALGKAGSKQTVQAGCPQLNWCVSLPSPKQGYAPLLQGLPRLLLWMAIKLPNTSTSFHPFLWISQSNEASTTRSQEHPALSGTTRQPRGIRFIPFHPGAAGAAPGSPEEPYLLPRRCGGMLVLHSHRARSISSHLPCRAEKAESDKSSIWKGKGTGFSQSFLVLNRHPCADLRAAASTGRGRQEGWRGAFHKGV